MDVYASVLIQDLGSVYIYSAVTKQEKSVHIYSLNLGCFSLFVFASGNLVVCHNSVEDKVGLNCVNCHLTKMR